MDPGVRGSLENVLQQGKHDPRSVPLEPSPQKLLESHVRVFLVQERSADREAASHDRGVFSLEGPPFAQARLCGRFAWRSFLEARQRSGSTFLRLGAFSQGDGRSVAAVA